MLWKCRVTAIGGPFHPGPVRRIRVSLVAGFTLALCLNAATAEKPHPSSLISLVDPFVGADMGSTTPGAQIPFGFVVLSPDTDKEATSGYSTKGQILGFSQTHVSGTGGGSKYGNFRVTPVTGRIDPSDSGSDRAEESAAPGYYTVRLSRHNIKAELTATRLAGIHRYTFQAAPDASILIDACSIVLAYKPEVQKPVGCEIRVVAPNRMEGTGSFEGGWNPSPYTLHFSAEFSRPFSVYGTWSHGVVSPNSLTAKGTHVGAYATFDARNKPTVLLKVGVSFVSIAKARENLLQEIPAWDFDAVRSQAKAAWEKALTKIQVSGGTDSERRIFYTALYRSHVMPHDLTGENIWWRSSSPHYEDYYCLWDTFRTLHPLLTLIQPERQAGMVQSLVETGIHTGYIPDARIAGSNGLTQGGSNGDVVVADALMKGLKGIDYAKAYEALVRDAEVDSARPMFEGREVQEYNRVGYLNVDKYRSSVSRSVEYAYDNFCIAEVAKALGRQDDYEKYLKRSGYWTNLWDPQMKVVRPRHADGSWLEPFDPLFTYEDYAPPYYEGTARQYATYVPHDVQGLINKLGGDQSFTAWLDEFFEKKYYDVGNEQDILAPYEYNHAGRPDRTAERIRKLLATAYSESRGGIPGDDDAGTMSSWFVWGAIGFYPNAGQPYYYIASPLFKRVSMDLGKGRKLVIEALDTSAVNLYVQSAELNGKPLDRCWVKHSEIANGARLVLHMGPKPTSWGSTNRPPSVSQPLQ